MYVRRYKKKVIVRLKSLEIKGFKSSADKTVVSFDEGITGIIGPNGCGKSNIIDSIRWVIGEQKISALRSENLEALVFNGSKTRSASGLAEVSLTFENTKNLLPTEFNTVTITRRFYKNGESEYRLNDVACRLKDIHNLFLDTGVSTDSYAIIELGMVDDIIKDKDNSRRRMLEQAAGITIYKTRKKEARNKLDATEQDLARIEDLLFEINNQLKSLESQARKAERYYELKKEYREVAIELAKASLEGFQSNYSSLTEQQEAAQDSKIQLEAAIASEEAAQEQEKLAFIQQERELQGLQQAFNLLLQELRSGENDKNLATQKLHYLKEKEKGLQDFLQKATGQLTTIGDSIEYTQLQLSEEEVRYTEMQQLVLQGQTGMEEKRRVFDEKRAGLDELRGRFQQLQLKQFDAEKKVAVADTSILNIQRTLQQLTDERTLREQQLQQLQQESTDKDQLLTDQRQLLQDLQEQHERTKVLIFDTQSALEALRNELNEENRKLDSKRNEYNLLKSLIDSMEGYPDSIKFLHNNPEWNHGAPVLSDILYVKEEYRTAVENLLEPYLNYYVTANLQEGLQAVHLLDEKKKGKANFFLLDAFNQLTRTVSQPAGTTRALDVVEVDGKYARLAEYLLGHVFIADDESALSQSGSGDAVILEKTGKYVRGKFTLSGGSIGLFEGKKIGRVKNLEKLAEEISDQEAVVNLLKSDIQAKHQEVIAFNDQLKEKAIRETEQLINRITNELFAARNKMENLQVTAQNALQRLEELEKRGQEEQSAIAATRELLTQLSVEMQQTGESLKTVEADYQQSEQEYNQHVFQLNESNLLLTRQQSKISGLQQELSFKKNQLTDLENQITQNRVLLEESVAAITESTAQLETAMATLQEMILRKEAEEKKLNEADQAFYVLRNTMQDKEAALRARVKNKEQVDQQIQALKDQVNELKLQLAGMKERLQVEFKINLDDIIEEGRTTETPQEELQATADRMRKRMENMGDVNPTAIEAFTEMKKRYEFILEQKNDLVTAKESLLKTIDEVEATANQQFLDTFHKVRENFQRVFKTLFTEEDTADMMLIDPDNLAETGIEIIAKPKGKKPSSITQLSGGEKTLTATALLFSIYLIKPAPFCIMDEVDAPLDDANVGKFTQMIKKFSDNSQFIIVTHNKQTMSTVDVIYGVTMQEPGVSKLVPVDFRSLAN